MSYATGPVLVLAGTALSAASIAVWGVNVGDGACAWRVAYSPRPQAFGIWSVIYPSTVVLCSLQIMKLVPVFAPWASVLWAAAWLLCAAWVPLFNGSSPTSLVLAAIVISAAAACATAATWVEGAWSWIGDSTRAMGALGLPLSLLAGWLLTASSIGIGIAVLANAKDAQQTCVRVPPIPGETPRSYRARRRAAYREAEAVSPVADSIVPAFLAAGVGLLAVAAKDPSLPLPVMWAIVNLKVFPGVTTIAELLLCLCGVAGAFVQLYYA